MKTWLVGGTVAVLVGIGFCLTAKKQDAPQIIEPGDFSVQLSTPQEPAAAPVLLDGVVDVSDLDALLDPPPITATEPSASGPMLIRVGYEEIAVSQPATGEIRPIPKSAE